MRRNPNRVVGDDDEEEEEDEVAVGRSRSECWFLYLS